MLKKIKMYVLDNAEHLLRKLFVSLPKSTQLNNETSAPILASTNEPNEVIAAKDKLKRIEDQCADAIKQCNRDVREMLSSARAESEEIIRSAKKEAEANSSDLQDARDPKLRRVKAQCADAIKQCNRDVREMFSSARAESEKIINSAKMESEEIISNAKSKAEANTYSATDSRGPKHGIVEAQCAEAIKQCNRDVREMLSSAKAQSEEIIRNAKNKAVANTDSAQATKDPKLSRVEAQCADAIKQCNRDVRIMFSSARAESEKIINSAKIEREEIIRNTKNEAETMIAELSQVNEKLSTAKAEREKIIQQGHDDARLILEKRHAEVDTQFSRLNLEISKKLELEKQLTIRIADLEKKIRKLERNITCITENKELIETVTPHQQLMEGPTSESIKTSLDDIKEQQKRLIIDGDAFNITDQILWNNSSAQGTAMQKRHGKFLIAAFNAVVDNLIAITNLTNFSTNAKKIEKWFSKANKNGDDSCIEINRQLLHLRLEEQRYFFEHKYKKAMEIEEQRYVKDSLREEAKVKKEIELFVQAREKEEATYLKDLNEAIDAVKVANDETVNKLNAHIADLKAKLERATSEKERALSMAQLTRSGYVYIISNRGSFGENIYKIGMTRRLEPMDRVKELGDASVPFFFDVHALISSDDAPTLEKQLHNKFASRRVNKVNNRREFFKATFDEIEEALNELVEGEFNLIKDVISEQFEETEYLEQRELNNG